MRRHGCCCQHASGLGLARVVTSQIRTSPSPLPEASQLPSGATASAARRLWRVEAARSCQVAASQIRTVPSPSLEASQLPSGATATAITILIGMALAGTADHTAAPYHASGPGRA
jgi:hypothetical protein